MAAPQELPAKGGGGPGQGETAVGGVTGRQEAGGHKGGPAEPTGGDTTPNSNAGTPASGAAR